MIVLLIDNIFFSKRWVMDAHNVCLREFFYFHIILLVLLGIVVPYQKKYGKPQMIGCDSICFYKIIIYTNIVMLHLQTKMSETTVSMLAASLGLLESDSTMPYGHCTATTSLIHCLFDDALLPPPVFSNLTKPTILHQEPNPSQSPHRLM